MPAPSPTPAPPSLRPTGWSGLACAALALCLCSVLVACASLPPMQEQVRSTALASPVRTVLGARLERERLQAHTPYPSGFLLLDTGTAAYTSRLALIEAARHTLDIQYYAIHADDSALALLQAIVRAALRGVRVRVLLDDFHSAGKNAQVMRLAFVPGIEMRMFNPVNGIRAAPVLRALGTLTDFMRAQQRMHNKLLIADNSVGIAGGRNLGDAYFDALDSHNFIDLDVMACGAIVQHLSRSFDAYWNDRRAYPVASLLSLQMLDTLLQQAVISPQEPLHSEESRTPTPVGVPPENAALHALLQQKPMSLQGLPWVWAPSTLLSDSPDKIAFPDNEPAPVPPFASATGEIPPPHTTATPSQLALREVLSPLDLHDNVVSGLLGLLQSARHEFWIVSPYFVPGTEMREALARAAARGVQVHIVTNSLASSDVPLAHAGYAKHREALLRMGIHLYELRSLQPHPLTLRSSTYRLVSSTTPSRAMLHSKLIVADGVLTAIGSMNMDMRSQWHNTEVALLVASPPLAAQAQAHIDQRLLPQAWRVLLDLQGQLQWHPPTGQDWGLQHQEPDASAPLRWMLQLLGPWIPEHLL